MGSLEIMEVVRCQVGSSPVFAHRRLNQHLSVCIAPPVGHDHCWNQLLHDASLQVKLSADTSISEQQHLFCVRWNKPLGLNRSKHDGVVATAESAERRCLVDSDEDRLQPASRHRESETVYLVLMFTG